MVVAGVAWRSQPDFPMSAPIKTLLVDDQVLFREAISTLLSLDSSIEIVGEAGNGVEALQLAAKSQPQVILMDLRMPMMDGVEATRRLRAAHPEMRVLVLTTFDLEEEVFDVLRAGAAGYILKDSPSAQLVEAIKVVNAGHAYLQPSVAGRVVAEFNRLSKAAPSIHHADPLLHQLSTREADIVRLLARGMSNKEIAVALFLTEGTVKNHMTSILEKFDAPDRTTVALRARDLGLT